MLRKWTVALTIWLVVSLFASLALWHLRNDALRSQTRELRLLTLALTHETDHGLLGIDEGLRALQAELQAGRLRANGIDTHAALLTRAGLMPWVSSIWLVRSDGAVLAASDRTRLPALASFVPSLHSLGAHDTALSRPFFDPLTRQMLVAFAVRFDDPGTGSAGLIVAAMPTAELLGAFPSEPASADARMVVLRHDGVRLADSSTTSAKLDEAALTQVATAILPMAPRRFSDGSMHLVSVRALAHDGLEVVLIRDLDPVLGAWREAAWLTALGCALLLAIMAAAVHSVQRAERRRTDAQHALESQQSRASKLESLGTLAGGVAHDFNNVLAAILGFAEMAQDAAAPGSAQARHIERVVQAALRGKSLAERILTFSRGGTRHSAVFTLQTVVQEVVALMSGSLRSQVVLTQTLTAPDGRMRGDPTQLFEAVMNLCTNAMQAMPGGGILHIDLRRVRVGALTILSHSQLSPGEYLALTVSDQGVGIKSEVMDHLFEPFFTTRSADSGIGLGLAVVHGVVAEFEGAIDVQSLPGHDTRFTLYFPECFDVVAVPQRQAEVARSGNGECVLVIDDEPALVALTAEILETLGYVPVGYTESVAALAAIRSDPGRFAAVITDEIMPGLSGTHFTEVLRGFAPTLPVLLVSGFGGAALASRAAHAGVTRVMTKPLQRTELALALSSLLH
jgi:signal transduction histidine kinase